MEKFSKDETTFQDTDLLEPISFYRDQLKDAFHDNAEEYFKKLTERAATDVDLNQSYCKKYYSEDAQVNTLKRNQDGKKGLKGFFIFLVVICVIAIILPIIFTFIIPNFPLLCSILIPIAGAGGLAGSIIGIVKMNRVISSLQIEIDKHQKIADENKAKAYETMASLNSLFESNMAAHLMSKTTPVIDLDQNFDPEKYSYLHDKYGYDTSNAKDTSVLFVQSGNILGNPFIFERTYNQSMRNHTYTGTLVISWTERVSDGKGGYRTVYRTQTLTAHVTQPEPYYYIDTTLIYGNEAAPNLSFSRRPTGHANDNEKELEKYIKKFDKKLDKEVEKDIDDTKSSFTRLHNDEFEALFDALNRDNELEFRLLFTPLAQKNMIALLKDKDHVGYGDDFSFAKRKQLNFINAGHMTRDEYLNYTSDKLQHFDYERCHSNFVNYCDRYCKSVYFSLAPLISIPLYQQHKTREYIYNGQFGHNVTVAEIEACANTHRWDYFKHPATRSDGIILKSKFTGKDDFVDNIMITAHSFEGIDRVTYVPVYGGDGHTHNVPVHWVEYLPISQDTPFVVGTAKEDNYPEFRTNYSGGNYNDILSRYGILDKVIYQKGLFSFIKKDK